MFVHLVAHPNYYLLFIALGLLVYLRMIGGLHGQFFPRNAHKTSKNLLTNFVLLLFNKDKFIPFSIIQ